MTNFFGGGGEGFKSDGVDNPKAQKSRAGIPSMRKSASRNVTSASVGLCETDVCFLLVQLFGTAVKLPNMQFKSALLWVMRNSDPRVTFFF